LKALLRWRCSLLRERQVHALVPAILLRLAGLDSLVANSELPPPSGNLGQAGDAGGCEGRPVVAAYRVRQTEFVEHLLHRTSYVVAVGAVEDNAREQVAAVCVGDGERVAARHADREMALEVDAPHLVRSLRVRERRREGRGLASAALRSDQAVAAENECEGTHRRQLGTRVAAQQGVPQLARPPLGLLPPGLNDGALDPRGHRPRAAVRAARAVAELAVVHEAPDPFVAGLPADAVAAAQLGNRELASQVLVDEAFPLGHG